LGLIKREVYYFENPGPENTDLVVEAVSKYLDLNKGISDVVVASTSGLTALKFARALKGKAKVICVTEAPYRREWGQPWPCLKPEHVQELTSLGAIVLDKAPYVFHSSLFEAAKWRTDFPELIVKETLYSLGQGFKVAVEVVLQAVSCGVLEPYKDVIGVGGSGEGADTAIVLRATYPQLVFSKDSSKRLEIREVIAMPLKKKWWEFQL